MGTCKYISSSVITHVNHELSFSVQSSVERECGTFQVRFFYLKSLNKFHTRAECLLIDTEIFLNGPKDPITTSVVDR